MRHRLKQTSAALAVSAFAFSSAVHGQLWTAGHGDLGIEYMGNNELELEWHLGEDNEAVVIDGTSQTFGAEGQGFEAGDLTAQTNLSGTRQAGTQWDFIGVASGETFYVFPQTEDPTVPFLGIGTEELAASDWSTDLTYTLTSLTGPGAFSLYTVDSFGAPAELISTDGGISGSVSQAAGTHEHYNWAFSKTGTYDLTFEVSGTHITDGLATGSETFSFSVVPEPASAGLFLAVTGLFAVFAPRRRV
ncbi:MAG: hypothetical protein GVY36_14155 [Verrucomicrobia bacterium]|jgi:surface-anchored protein|nr:hypothetical protein [Verrucomicrobiota bacterium]